MILAKNCLFDAVTPTNQITKYSMGGKMYLGKKYAIEKAWLSKRLRYGDKGFEEAILRWFYELGSNISDIESISHGEYINSNTKIIQLCPNFVERDKEDIKKDEKVADAYSK